MIQYLSSMSFTVVGGCKWYIFMT